MITNGATPALLFALVLLGQGSLAMAEGSASKTATQTAAARPAHLAKAGAAADPFEELAPAPKPAAGPTAAAPAKPAAVAAPPAQNLPSKELQAFMKGLEGSWKCDTKFGVGSLVPGSQPFNAKTDVTIRKEQGGFSWHGEFRLAKTATTAATSGMFQIGYAAGIKHATFLSYDSVGTAMMGTGALAGDSVTFAEEGFLKGSRVKVRETLASKGPRSLYHKVEIEQSNGYQAMAEDTCTK